MLKFSHTDSKELNQKKPSILIRRYSNYIKAKLSQPLFIEFYAETFGTMIMILIGLSGIAQIKFSSLENRYFSDLLSPNILAGISLAIAILITGKVTSIFNKFKN